MARTPRILAVGWCNIKLEELTEKHQLVMEKYPDAEIQIGCDTIPGKFYLVVKEVEQRAREVNIYEWLEKPDDDVIYEVDWLIRNEDDFIGAFESGLFLTQWKKLEIESQIMLRRL